MTLIDAMKIFFSDEDESFVFSESSLKSKYRLLSKKYHPDMKSRTSSEEMFKKTAEAYTVIKESLAIYGNDYDKIWSAYKGKTILVSPPKNSNKYNNYASMGFDTSAYEVPDNMSKMIVDILYYIFILKGYLYKKFKNFNFPNDEYLADCLIKFKFPDKYNLETESLNLKIFMDSLCKELSRVLNWNFNVDLNVSNYGVYEFNKNLEKIWDEINLYEKASYKKSTKEDVINDCKDLIKEIEKVISSNGNMIDIFRFKRLQLLLNSKDVDLNKVLLEIYYFLKKCKMNSVSDDIYRNNQQVIRNFRTSSNLPEISKMLGDWKDEVFANELIEKK